MSSPCAHFVFISGQVEAPGERLSACPARGKVPCRCGKADVEGATHALWSRVSWKSLQPSHPEPRRPERTYGFCEFPSGNTGPG